MATPVKLRVHRSHREPGGPVAGAPRRGSRDALWLGFAVAILVILTLLVLRFHDRRESGEREARARSLELVGRIRAELLAASEAEKSAVLASTDEASRAFADEARAHGAAVDRTRQELASFLERYGTGQQQEALAAFATAFDDVQRTDATLLAQAEKNTNPKAFALTYGPATEAVNEMAAALERLGADADGSAPRPAALIAARAEIGALRILTTLPAHIAEPSDARMTEMEGRMTAQVAAVRGALAELAGLPDVAASADLTAAAVAWDRFLELQPQILALSRENTDVRSFELSLAGKRTALAGAEEALDVLQRSIASEAVPAGRWLLPQ